MFENQTESRVFPGKNTVGLAALVLLIPLSSCVSNLEPLNVTNFFGLISQSGVCEANTSAAEVSGLLDTSLADAQNNGGAGPGFMLGVEITNSLTPITAQPIQGNLANPNNVRIDSHTAELDSLVAKYQFTATDGQVVQIPDRTFPESVIVLSNQLTRFVTPILDPRDEPALSGKDGSLTVQLTFSGKLEDGGSISSTPADFTIRVCSNCVAICPAGDTTTLTCGIDAAAQPDGFSCSAKMGG